MGTVLAVQAVVEVECCAEKMPLVVPDTVERDWNVKGCRDGAWTGSR